MAEVQIDDGILTLPENMGIAQSAETKLALQKLLGHDGDIALDGSQVARSDAAGLQLLLAFFRQCQERERECEWKGISELLQTDIAGLGLASELRINLQAQGGQS